MLKPCYARARNLSNKCSRGGVFVVYFFAHEDT